MLPEIKNKLLYINQEFYQTFGGAFAATRRRVQPGVRRVLGKIPPAGRWLDLGCGSGALAVEWARQSRQGLYLGVDSSPVLLAEARAGLPQVLPAGLKIDFIRADLSQENWAAGLAAEATVFDGALCFAVLHHLPGRETRVSFLAAVRRLLAPGALFILSVWQFQHSPKLMARVQPWTQAGLAGQDLDPGDTLLDWRAALPGQTEQNGLRYVHLFSPGELEGLAKTSGFEVGEQYESDGEGGRLGLYQVWTAV